MRARIASLAFLVIVAIIIAMIVNTVGSRVGVQTLRRVT